MNIQTSRAMWAVGFLVCLSLTSCKGNPLGQGDLEAQVLEIIRNNPEVVLESVRNYQQEQEANQEKAQAEAAKKLMENPKETIGKSPTMGATDNKIVLVEFSDFQCPFCAKAHATVNQFMEKHGDRVTLVYKHLPLQQIHDQAIPAALASWAAQQQGKFWEYHNGLFENQERLGPDLYLELAKKLELDLDRFQKDVESPEATAAIQTDLKLAEQLGLSGTPVFFMNGKGLTGAVSLEDMEALLTEVSEKAK